MARPAPSVGRSEVGPSSKWVTRARIRVNRTATAWLIRRFIDPAAAFLFVEPEQVAEAQSREAATGFDAPGATYPHIDAVGRCSFEALVEEYRPGDGAPRARADHPRRRLCRSGRPDARVRRTAGDLSRLSAGRPRRPRDRREGVVPVRRAVRVPEPAEGQGIAMIVKKTDTRRRLWRTLLVAGIAAIGVDDADAALIPSVSEALRGRPPPSFESPTLDGQPFSSRVLIGKPVIVNFFASWCPVCSMELKDLQTLQPELRQRGISVVEVLVDPVETPDTVDVAGQQLARNLLPFA